MVKKARADSQSQSLQENKDDATFNADDILSLDETTSNLPPKKLEPLILGARKKEVKLSPLKVSPSASPKRELKLFKQRSEDFAIGTKKLSLGFSSFDDDKDGNFDKHPRTLDKPEIKLSGGGAMFLKSNTKKSGDVCVGGSNAIQAVRQDSLQGRWFSVFYQSI